MLKYKLDEIEAWAKQGQAISHHVVMTMVKEIRDFERQSVLTTELSAKLNDEINRHAKTYANHVTEANMLREKIAVAETYLKKIRESDITWDTARLANDALRLMNPKPQQGG